MEHKFCPYCMAPVEDGKPCGACGLTQGSYTPSPHHLPPGTVLKERYLVGRVLGEGGFGITYIGCDLQLELKVAIKEYFPTDKASRMAQASLDVASYTGAAGVNYDKGLKKFLQEARTIARMDKQPVIVNVRDFFEINHTAYIVMEYVEGTTFKELVEQRGGRIPAGELLYLIEPLFFALKEMHANGLIHRDISPENLMIEKGEVRLLDFGCARESADGGNTLTIALKHGYAPVEQYQSKGQGPWTDVYALSATIYYCLTGTKPPQAMDRLVEDELVPPRKLGVDLTQRQEQALLYGMGVPPKRRFQSMDEFHTALYEGFVPGAAEEAAGRKEPAVTVAAEDTGGGRQGAAAKAGAEKTEKHPFDLMVWLSQNRLLAGGIAAALVLVILLAAVLPRLLGPGEAGQPDSVQTAGPSDEPSIQSPEGTAPPADSQAYTEYSLLSLLENDTVDSVVIPGNTWLSVNAPVTLTKPLRIEAGAGVTFNKGLTVAGGGWVQAWGNVESYALLRTMDGGSISVESGGHAGTHMLWLEGEDDLACAPDGAVDVFGNADPTKGTLSSHELSHYLVLDEDALFAGAVHISSEEEFARHYGGGVPMVIDSDLTLTRPYWSDSPIEASILIPEGVTLNAPCPDPRDEGDSNCTLELEGGAVLVNHGTFTGRLSLHCGRDGQGGWVSPSYFVNYGTFDANLWTELSAVINLGDMTTREIMNNGALANVGSVTLDGLLEMSGNWSNNGGTITVTGSGRLNLYGSTGWNNCGDLIVEDGGRFENYALFNQNSAALTVRSGGALDNFGQLWVNESGILTAEAGAAELVNHGVTLYSQNALKLAEGWSEESTGRLLANVSGGDLPYLGDRVRYVDTESELRSALDDDSCELVVWNGYEDYSKININGGALTVTKGLVFNNDDAHPVDLTSGGITVTGENAFLVSGGMDSHGSGLTVEDGATVVINSAQTNLGRLDVGGGGLACFSSSLFMQGGEINIDTGGRVIDANGGRLEDCAVRVGADSGLCLFAGLDLTGCDVTIDGSFNSFFANVFQKGGSFINNGWARFAGWPDYVHLYGDISNHGELYLGGRHTIGGTLVNEADGVIVLDWENSPLRVSGRLENKGRIQGCEDTYVETVDGGVFTGNPVSYD